MWSLGKSNSFRAREEWGDNSRIWDRKVISINRGNVSFSFFTISEYFYRPN